MGTDRDGKHVVFVYNVKVSNIMQGGSIGILEGDHATKMIVL